MSASTNSSTADAVLKALTALTVVAMVLAVVFYEHLIPGPASDWAQAIALPGTDTRPVLLFEDHSQRVFDAALMLLRAGLGMMIFVHGYNKAFRGGRLAGTARWFESMGMRPGDLHAAAAAFTEMGVGVLLVLGLLTQIGAAGLIALMVVAFWTVHRDKGFMITGEGWEYVALIALMALVTAIVGPGLLSLDAHLDITQRLDGWTGFGIAVLLGLGAGVAHLLIFYRPPKPADTA